MRDVDSQISILDVFLEVFFNLVYVYSVAIMTSYIVLAAISFYYVRNYIRKNQVVDYRDLLNTPIYQSVSVLAPAYNEAATIIDNIRSLMSIHYPNFEVIIINDGSKDDTLARCINAYDMVPVDFAYFEHVACKPIRAVYKSKNRAFSHLTVVDKVNGGKSDALNAGINVSKMKYITCIDVDCILEQDAILKMMKPFAEAEEGVEVIATGGVIRIANSCKIEDGRITQVRAPENMVARFQALEYLRAFLLGRMAWSHLDGLLLISGALGIFNKKVAIEAGGYSHKTVGEDMELVVRMRMLMQDKGLKYKVAFIPDPLCWTEAPESWNVLVRQRNRWTRGTIYNRPNKKYIFFNQKVHIAPLMKAGLVAYFNG
jgi:biofilm PGA synthesis N-glycosyltransferase PgaC